MNLRLIVSILALLATLGSTSRALAMLNSDLGRWMTRDPLGYADGNNLYMYGVDSPVRHVDASGTWAVPNPQALSSPPWHVVPCPECLVTDFGLACLYSHLRQNINCPELPVICTSEVTGGSCNGVITVLNPNLPCNIYLEALVHETVHELDYCNNNIVDDCVDKFCTEIRAISLVDCRAQPTPHARRDCAINKIRSDPTYQWENTCILPYLSQHHLTTRQLADQCLNQIRPGLGYLLHSCGTPSGTINVRLGPYFQ